MKRLIKKQPLNGASYFESYTVQDYNMTNANKTMYVTYAHVYMDSARILVSEILTAFLNNDNNYDMVVDPAWSSTSTPPKPEGFNMDDVSTWGTITFDQIPMVKQYLEQNYNAYLKYKDNYTIDEAIIRALSDIGTLPKIGTNIESDWIIQ